MFYFDAFSLREPVSTWLQTLSAARAAKKSRPPKAAGRLRSNFFLLLSEVIVDARAHQSEPVAVRHAGDGEVVVRKIDIEIFDLGAPVRGEAEFGAHARGPARRGVRFRQPECLAAQLAESQTAGAVEQDVAERIAGPAAHRA